MQERIIELTYENEQLKAENKTLREKLQQAYDYMKQFVINGKIMLEEFLKKNWEGGAEGVSKGSVGLCRGRISCKVNCNRTIEKYKCS